MDGREVRLNKKIEKNDDSAIEESIERKECGVSS